MGTHPGFLLENPRGRRSLVRVHRVAKKSDTDLIPSVETEGEKGGCSIREELERPRRKPRVCERTSLRLGSTHLGCFCLADSLQPRTEEPGEAAESDRPITPPAPPFTDMLSVAISAVAELGGWDKNWCCCSVTVMSDSLRPPWACRTPGFPVHHHLPAFAQTHVHSQ